jgi:hypothetical protein
MEVVLRSLRMEQLVAFRRVAESVLVQQDCLDRKLATLSLILANLRNRQLHER